MVEEIETSRFMIGVVKKLPDVRNRLRVVKELSSGRGKKEENNTVVRQGRVNCGRWSSDGKELAATYELHATVFDFGIEREIISKNTRDSSNLASFSFELTFVCWCDVTEFAMSVCFL